MDTSTLDYYLASGTPHGESMSTTKRAQSSKDLKGKVIVLNGFPGIGKHTILKLLQARISGEKVRAVDNHLLIDPASAIYPDRGPAHHALRRKLRDAVFVELRHLAKEGYTVLMTACLAETDADVQVYGEYLDIVRDTGIAFYWFSLHCEMDSLELRATSSERVQRIKTKLTDLNVLRGLVTKLELVQPNRDDKSLTGVHVSASELDVSGTPDEAARMILDIVNDT